MESISRNVIGSCATKWLGPNGRQSVIIAVTRYNMWQQHQTYDLLGKEIKQSSNIHKLIENMLRNGYKVNILINNFIFAIYYCLQRHA
jgi:hypothetical protein